MVRTRMHWLNLILCFRWVGDLWCRWRPSLSSLGSDSESLFGDRIASFEDCADKEMGSLMPLKTVALRASLRHSKVKNARNLTKNEESPPPNNSVRFIIYWFRKNSFCFKTKLVLLFLSLTVCFSIRRPSVPKTVFLVVVSRWVCTWPEVKDVSVTEYTTPATPASFWPAWLVLNDT